jgi:hypothetical protein
VAAAERLARVPGVELVSGAFFNEFTLRLPKEARPVVRAMAERGVLGGVSLGRLYPGAEGLANGLVVAVTETSHEKMSRRSRARSGRAWHERESRAAGGPIWAAARTRSPDPRASTGNRALMLEEALIFEMGDVDTTGVDVEDCAPAKAGAQSGFLLSQEHKLYRNRPIGLPGLSEPETVRHYTRLSRQNYGIDLGLFPLGSCTMKHNPRLNEKVARMPGFADIHPLQPTDTVQGALELIELLGGWLVKLTGMHSVAMSPKAGAHGELCGLLAIRSALEARGDARQVILVPESAHGTNPATAAFAGYRVENIPANARGRVDLDALKSRLGPDVAGVMITNPNTCGLFEPDMIAISEASMRGRPRLLRWCQFQRDRRPRAAGRSRHRRDAHQSAQDLLHPAWRRRPGSGPVVFSEALTPFAPLPFVERQGDRFCLVEEETAGEHHGQSFGRMTGVPRPDGDVHPRHGVHPEPWRRRPAPGLGRRGAERELRPAPP